MVDVHDTFNNSEIIAFLVDAFPLLIFGLLVLFVLFYVPCWIKSRLNECNNAFFSNTDTTNSKASVYAKVPGSSRQIDI